MDRVPFLRGIAGEGVGVDWDGPLSSEPVESTDGSFLQLSQASHLFHLSFLDDDDHGEPRDQATESLPLQERPDIDSAVLEELRRATVRAGELPDPMRADQASEERPDIDAAMLEALRRARVGDREARDG
jgi:hypothetical protein